VGAVVGRVTIRRSGEVSAPAEGRFRVHLEDGPKDFAEAEEALSLLETHLSALAQKEAVQAGAEGIRVTVLRDLKTAEAEGREVFIEGTITVEASGRPRIAAE
jgi:archaeosine-15-forming tRNA-guanine transglycosylase